MSNNVILSQALKGDIVPRNFIAGYIVLSYLVSYVGAWTTLELINRRTAGRGLYNRYLLFGSSISMGGIAIWCMHYIGNRAIVLGDGQPAIQIEYNSGYTAISFFVPILVLLAAFTALGFDDKVSIARITIGGTLAGLAICGMHYLGQAGISNYTSVYSIWNVLGSAFIAAVASIVALFVFFVLRATWTNSWWKRALCASILAGAVFGMHWMASVGTQYRLHKTDPFRDVDISRKSTVIVVIVLSVAGCFILIVLAALAQTRRSRSASRAQQVVLAAAIFDKNGRIMVTPEGLLPNQAVASSYVKRSLDEVFEISHPAFHWIFRATRNWNAISRLLPGMRNHIYNISALKRLRPGLKSETYFSNVEGGLTEDYSIIFRELFCIAAADLAKNMNEPLENVGILFDEVFSTGQKVPLKPDTRRNTPRTSVDLESYGTASSMLGKGQLLFLVRRVNRREAECLSASGYRFAEIKNVVHLIECSMQINCNDLQGRLSSMIGYSDETHVLKPGVHVACFAIRKSVGGDFDVLVRKDARNQLPTMQLPIDDLNDWKIDYLSQLDGWSVTECLKFLIAKSGKSTNSSIMKKVQTFAAQLYDALERLKEEINDPFFADALLIARPVLAPCCGLGRDVRPGQATLLVFRLPVPIQLRPRGQNLEFVPLSFFRTQQYVHRNSPDHAVFARKIHREFGPILNEKRLSVGGDGRKNLRGARLPRSSIMAFWSRCTLDFRGLLNDSTPAKVQGVYTKAPGLPFCDSESDGEPRTSPRVNLGCDSEVKLADTNKFGGILVSQEINVDIRDLSNSTAREAMDGLRGTEMVEMQHAQIGTSSRAVKEAEDPETFVDKLLAIYISK